MKKFGNILWFIIFGLILSVVFIALGIVFCATLIGIPIGIRYFKGLKFVAFPFGKVKKSDFDDSPIFNTLFMLFGGFELGITFLLLGFVLCITVIGIPFGLQFIKIATYLACPFGAEIVSKEVAKNGYSFYGNNIK